MVYTSACLSAPAVQRTAFLQRDRRRCLWDSGMLGTHAPAAYSKSGWITDRKNDLRAFSDNWREVRFIAPIFRATLEYTVSTWADTHTVKSLIFVRYPFSYFWLETGSYKLISQFWAPQNKIALKFEILKTKRNFHAVLNLVRLY